MKVLWQSLFLSAILLWTLTLVVHLSKFMPQPESTFSSLESSLSTNIGTTGQFYWRAVLVTLALTNRCSSHEDYICWSVLGCPLHIWSGVLQIKLPLLCFACDLPLRWFSSDALVDLKLCLRKKNMWKRSCRNSTRFYTTPWCEALLLRGRFENFGFWLVTCYQLLFGIWWFLGKLFVCRSVNSAPKNGNKKDLFHIWSKTNSALPWCEVYST